MNEIFNELNELMEAFKENAAKQVEKGNKSAGAKARKTSLALAEKLKEFRKVSIEASKTK